LDEVEHFVTGTLHTVEVDRILATVLLVDIVDSTRHLVGKGDRLRRDFVERFFGVLRREINGSGDARSTPLGDGILATYDPARGIRCACAMSTGVRSFGIEIRADLHSGECELEGDSVRGIAVHMGARVAAMAGPGEILVSSTVKDMLAGSGVSFADRGAHSQGRSRRMPALRSERVKLTLTSARYSLSIERVNNRRSADEQPFLQPRPPDIGRPVRQVDHSSQLAIYLIPRSPICGRICSLD
jgi:class 3 adenylate cyclase